MTFLHQFFALNRDLIYFIYGLVFFLLGAVIAIQSRTYSRLDLARSLKWLAAFGFTHGLHEWGDLFIPMQAAYLGPDLIAFLHKIHLLLLAISFVFLFEFGVALLRPLEKARWLHGIPGALLAIWFFVVYFPLASLIPNPDTWFNVVSAITRYSIGLPSGILAAYALRQHTLQRIVPLQVPDIVRWLQFAGILLAVYAVLAGLIVPQVSFFPGNLINTVTFEQSLGFPPPIVRSIVGLGLLIAILRGLEVFDVETGRMIEAMEEQQILSTERDRLARELHDGAIQKVYTAGLLVESAQKLVSPEDPVLSGRLSKAVAVLHDAIIDLRQNLTDLHTPPNQDSLPVALQKLAEDPRFRSLVDITLDVEIPATETLSPVRAQHVVAITNEALSNVVRHARAAKVMIRARQEQGRLKLTIQDNGSGIPRTITPGYGLRNMRDRARLLGGEIDFENLNGRGTLVTLDIPWKDER